MMQSVLIIGGGQAGAWVARTLRTEGYDGYIALCGDEQEPPYERPPLSKEQLQPEAPAMSYLITPAEFAELNIDWKPGDAATCIERGTRTVELASGARLSYDALVLATGGRAYLPPVPGFELDCVHTLRTLADARRLRDGLKAGARVLVVGGGWIGLEVAAAARAAGCNVTLAEMADRLCSRSGPAALSAYLLGLHQARGVRVRLGASVTALRAAGQGGCVAVFADGSELPADLVVVGAGLKPNDELAAAAGLECGRGILVDTYGRSSDRAIYAAGDVALLRRPDGSLRRLESWQNAQDQGMAVAHSILGKPRHYDPQPFFWSNQYDVLIQLAGDSAGARNWVVRAHDDHRQTHMALNDDGRLQFGLSINAPRDLRFLRRQIADGTRLDLDGLADLKTPLEKVSRLAVPGWRRMD
ncbi:ferredoxin reductase [Bordetella petrii]|nr:ferredoxin reductase [Bordetella petrii]